MNQSINHFGSRNGNILMGFQLMLHDSQYQDEIYAFSETKNSKRPNELLYEYIRSFPTNAISAINYDDTLYNFLTELNLNKSERAWALDIYDYVMDTLKASNFKFKVKIFINLGFIVKNI